MGSTLWAAGAEVKGICLFVGVLGFGFFVLFSTEILLQVKINGL